mgnify:CR=1 FL=1
MEFTKEQKEELEKQIVDMCISALENKVLNEQQMGDISFFVLERIDLIKTQDEYEEFLAKLSSRWSVFSSMMEIALGQKGVIEDKKTVEHMEELIKTGDLNGALDAAHLAEKGTA